MIGAGLKNLTVEILANGLQVSPSNPIDGLQGRASLLMKLGDALNNQDFFGVDSRPGNMLGRSIPVFRMLPVADLCRLSPAAPNITYLWSDDSHPCSNIMDSFDGRFGSHLATIPNSIRRCISW